MDQGLRDQIAGMLRIAVPVLLTFLSSNKIIAPESVGPITEVIINLALAVVVIGSLIWSYHRNKATSQIEAVSQMPGVKKVVADPAISEVALKENPKVVPP